MPPRAQALAPPPAPDARFAFSYFGNPTTIEDCISAVSAHPVLLMGPENVLTKLMPGAFDFETYKPNVGVSLYAINFMFDGGIIMEPTVLNQGVHFIWKPERLQKLCKDLDAGGMAWEPIEGIDVIAIPKAARAITSALRMLPDDQRLLVHGDFLYDSADAANAETESWFDAMTVQLLISGCVNGMEMLAQFGSIIPDWFTKENRESDEFVSALAQIEGSVGRDISSLPIRAQAAVIAQWFKRTKAPPDMEPYTLDPSLEIERRACTDEQSRFAPLLKMGWRSAYPFLDKLWPGQVDDIVINTSGLMISLDVAGGSVTPQSMRALSIAIKDYEAFAIGSTNEERTAQIIHAHKHADDDKDLSAESKAILQANEPYQTFRASIERHAPDDHMGVAKTAMQSPHAAGLLLLNKLLKGDILFKERLGATTEAILQAIVNKAVAKNNRGEEVDDWPNLITGEFAKKLIAGRFAEIHFWNALKAVVGKQQGKALVDKIDKRLATAPSAEVFADSEAMRYLEVPARAVMALIGFTSTDGNSFAAMLKTLMRLAAAIENMPATCEPRKGLRKALLETAAKLMQCPQTRWECMLATPATAVKRIGDFVTAGHALNAVNALEGHVDRFMKELDDGMHLLAKDAANNVRDEPTHKSEHKPEYGSEQKSGAAWGSSAAKYGITASTDGKRIAWGTQVVTDYETAPDTKTHCPGRFAPASSQHLWCWDPNACWAKGGEKAHERLPEFPKEACKASNVGKLTQPIDWDDMTITIVAPGQNRGGGGRNANGKRNREDDGQRQQGKGKGKGAGKGKGKGGGRNGGKGGGRGFQRQPQ